MAAKNRTSKKKVKSLKSILEELDRFLYEGRWQDIDYSLKKMSKKTQILPGLPHFFKALEHIEAITMEKPAPSLHEINQLLKTALENCQTEEYAVVRVMIKIKQGQIAWIENETVKALNKFPQAASARRVDKVPIHTSKVFMEASLYTGLCTEVLYEDRRDKLTGAVGAYEECLRVALDITCLAKSSGFFVHPAIFRAIRTSLERGPILCVKLNNPIRAIGFFRRVLMTKEEHILPQVRKICATSLASSLLFLVSPGSYFPFTYSQTIYSPSQLSEEAILTCNLVKNFVGSVKDTNSKDAVAVFDLITLTLTDAKLPAILVQTLEESIPFTSSCSHIWIQFALALLRNNLYQQAEAVFHECIRVFPEDISITIMAANFVLESMCNPQLCLKWAKGVLHVAKDHYLEPKLYLVLGKAQSVIALKELTFEKQQLLQKKSLEYFERAVKLDPQGVEFIFQYALHLAQAREISAAREQVQNALGLSHDHTGCLHLLALLLTSDKQYTEALQICELALQQHPDNLSLLKTKILLQVANLGVHPALQTCKQALKIWQKLYSDDTSGLIGAVTQDDHSLYDLPLKSLERDEPTFVTPDIASDAGSSHSSTSSSPALNPPVIVQAHIWCLIADVFINGRRFSDATLCVQEAQFLASYPPVVSITNGKVLESENQLEIALDQYNNALALQPYNSSALTHVGRVLHLQDKNEEAEKHLREAISIDRLNHEAWFWLGKVFTAQKEHEHATDCFKTSLQFESSAPIQAFSAALSEQLLIDV